jgi:two-component system response regulator MprA
MYTDGQDILVVVNDPAQRERITRTLANEGFAVTEAAEGLAALRAIGSHRYGLMIAALRLPGSLDGRATARQARLRQPWLKTLFTEEYGHHPERGDSETDDFVPLPCERYELLGCVFELLQRGAAGTQDDLARRVRTERRAS